MASNSEICYKSVISPTYLLATLHFWLVLPPAWCLVILQLFQAHICSMLDLFGLGVTV
jgi:hypothetical protein